MDRRFVRVWREVAARRDSGEPMPELLRCLRTDELVAALAGVGETDPVAANAIATELLNRQARAPFLGAMFVSLGFFVAIFVLDLIFTGTPVWQLGEARRRGYALAALTAVATLASGMMYASWRGWWRAPARLLRRVRHRSY